VDQRRLSRAVRPNKPVNLSVPDVEIDAVKDFQPGERFRDACHIYKTHTHLPHSAARDSPRKKILASLFKFPFMYDYNIGDGILVYNTKYRAGMKISAEGGQ
jgi:hypothetical protein